MHPQVTRAFCDELIKIGQNGLDDLIDPHLMQVDPERALDPKEIEWRQLKKHPPEQKPITIPRTKQWAKDTAAVLGATAVGYGLSKLVDYAGKRYLPLRKHPMLGTAASLGVNMLPIATLALHGRKRELLRQRQEDAQRRADEGKLSQ